jgi:starch phosphorylase
LAHHRSEVPKVAYFCMEYGLNEELQIYAGGLGVLAGDYIKAAKDEGFPMVALGILWRQDYTHQFIGQDLMPYDLFPNLDYKFLKDTGVTITVQVRGEEVPCKVRLADQYGNVPLYLLDTNFPGSPNGWMTNRLYAGGPQERVAAEIILGIGGIRALRALKIPVDVYHFNEGHAILAGIELIREKMAEGGLSFEDAWRETRKQVVFTTHTPVAAGNESHDHELLKHMGAYNGLDYSQMKFLGGDPFNLTVAALRLSRISNAVSKTHGKTARNMWRGVYHASPIISITNGVHIDTWQDRGIKKSFKTGGDIWEPHMRLKKDLVGYVRQHTGTKLNENALIIGFARRAAPYKRSDLIFRNEEIIAPLLREKKIQLVFSGKAHPEDRMGKEIIRSLIEMDRKYRDSIVFLENYNMEVARMLVQGCDLWLNNPRRPMEASGTSGMKAAVNGVLNLSIVDGWVGEGPQHGVSGWLIESTNRGDPGLDQDEEDLKALYEILTGEVIQTFYNDRTRWLEMMFSCIDMSHWQFSSQRMIREYYDLMYQEEEFPFEDEQVQEQAGQTGPEAAFEKQWADQRENVFVYNREYSLDP